MATKMAIYYASTVHMVLVRLGPLTATDVWNFNMFCLNTWMQSEPKACQLDLTVFRKLLN